MKAITLPLLLVFALNLCAQNPNSIGASTPTAPLNSAPVEISPYAVTQRGPHDRVWQNVVAVSNSVGNVTYRTNSYSELGTGLCYWNDSQWIDASDQIQITPNGASANNTQHQVNFAANLNTAGAINLTTPEGYTMASQVVGLSYYDSTTGTNVLFAETQDSTGQLVPSGNQVIYTNAFTHADCDVLYVHSLAGLEQDIIVRQQLPSPASYGLAGSNIWLQVWTEFTSAPEPQVSEQANGDSFLDFGVMKMGPGRAFMLGNASNAAPVLKEWVHVQGRTFLVESVKLATIAAKMSTLPVTASLKGKTSMWASLARQDSRPVVMTPNIKMASFKLPPPKVAKKISEPMRFANIVPKGLVLDYITVNGSQTNTVFQSDTTYFITNQVQLYGTTAIEGGTVVKFGAHGGEIILNNSNILCKMGPYRPAVFTAMDDNSIGAAITGSTGSPTNDYGDGSGALCFNYIQSAPGSNFFNFRFEFLNCAVGLPSSEGYYNFYDSQFVNCYSCFAQTGETDLLRLYNCLFYNCEYVASYGPFVNNPQLYSVNVTMHGCTEVATAPDGYSLAGGDLGDCIFKFTNSLVVTSDTSTMGGYFSTNSTAVLSSDTGVFQTVGTAAHYLADDSPYRDYGNTNISAALVADLSQKTTYPPIVFAGIYYTNSSTLFPQAQRDYGGNPDLGYHYDPIDFAFGGVLMTNATLTVTPGTVIAGFNTNGIGYGLAVCTGAQLLCQGTPTSLCRIVDYNTVQEQSITNWSAPATGVILSDFIGYSPASVIDCRFTDFSIMAQDANHVNGNFYGRSQIPNFQDCQFHGGMLTLETGVNLTNCLLERVNSTFISGAGSNYLQNCLFWRGSVSTFHSFIGTIQDNLFDQAVINDNGGYTYGYNGFCYTNSTNFLSLTNANDVFLGSVAYQTSWYGNYYQATNDFLFHVGNTNASLLGLYHYTTQTNQTKEGTNRVTIGYHYVAANTNGLPIDTDGDGIQDYVEDANGNGTFDAGETDWTNPNVFDLNGLPIAWYLQQGLNPNAVGISSQDPDYDGLINIQEYLYGTKPLVPEGTAIWVGNPSGYSGIP